MQTALNYRTNRDLFSNYYIDEYLPETNAWDELSDDELREARADIMDLWEREKGTAPRRNEAQLEARFIRPLFQKLGIPYEVEESTSRTQRRPDYGFFGSDDAARGAFDRREQGGDFYENAIAVADAKRWGRSLDTRGSGEDRRDFENPSYQIHVYLQETPTQWAVLTNGKKWRLYYGPTSHRLDSYYEVDLPTILEKGDLKDFKYFYLFFRHGAFLEDAGGECFLDEVYDESNVFAQELGEDLQDNIYEAIKILSEGFIQYSDNNLSEDDLDLIHDSSLIYLYRLIFVLYAESEGRDLLDTNNEVYEESYSLNTLKQDVVEELDSPSRKYLDWRTNLWDRLDELFKLIDQGSKSQGIPKEDLYIPAYNGGLFRTDPDENDSTEAHFLANHQVGDSYLAKVIELLTRSQNDDTGGKVFVDYSSLDVGELGSIYEGLLEYQLNVADEPLALEDGEYVSAGNDGDVIVQKGEVYLTTDSGERKATGSYYTPEYVVEYIVENTLEPLVEDIRMDLAGQSARGEDRGFAAEFANRVFDLKILDPAMGSGHFLTSAIDYLSREIVDAQEKQARQEGIETIDEDHDINWARRQVAQRCIYGVDLNPLAVELSKVSLWLRTLAAEQPLAFLDHRVKTGNSLVGSDITEVLSDDNGDDQQLTLGQFMEARQRTLRRVMNLMQDLLAIDNDELDDIKSMEELYDEIRDDPLYHRLFEIANVHTAEQFGLDVPDGVYEKMAGAIDDGDKWEEIRSRDWFASAQATADDQSFFHWELEYPEAFFSKDGGKLEEAGFDAVIGNPPYVRQEQISELKPYLTTEYVSFDTAADLYVYFLEKGHRLTKQHGMMSYIVSNKFMMSSYGKNLRRYLNENSRLCTLIDFHDLPVFSREVSTYPLIIGFEKDNPHENTMVDVTKVKNLSFDELSTYVEKNQYTISQDDLTGSLWNLADQKSKHILDKMDSSDSTLTGYIGSPLYRGLLTGLNAAFVIDSETKESLIRSDESNEQFIYPVLKGDDISRYFIDFKDRYIIRIPSGWSKEQGGCESENKAWEWFNQEYSALASYLSQYEDKAKSRHDRGDCWWELRPCDYYNLFEESKVIYPDISDGSTFAFDDTGYHMVNTCYFFPTSSKGIVALLNSNLITWYYEYVTSEYRGGYNRSFTNAIEDFPIPENALMIESDFDMNLDVPSQDTTNRELLDNIGGRIINLINKSEELNLSLLDHFGSYTNGPPLSNIGLTQPPSGSANSIIQQTATEKPNLRVGEVNIVRETENTIEIQLTARYKPDNEDPYETDQWGYTETEPLPALRITDLTETEADLIEAFVPVAVDEAGGFADFRETATKTNSLVDRLHKLTLPAVSDVETGLKSYMQTKERGEELEAKIEQTDELIDEIVYELYGLTDEEIEIVESAVQND